MEKSNNAANVYENLHVGWVTSQKLEVADFSNLSCFALKRWILKIRKLL